MFVGKAHAESIEQVEAHQSQLALSRQEISKTKAQLEEVSSEKQKLQNEVKLRDEKIQQLESENKELKD